MRFNTLKLCCICLFVSAIIAGTARAQSELANPSFEEDAANVGNPDGWSIPKDAKAKVVHGNASAGNRALLIEDGYIAVFQDLQVPQLAGQTLSFSIDAKGVSDGAVFGVRIGYYSNDNKWHDAPLLWNKPLTAEYQTYSASHSFPADAKPGRLYIGVYRSDKKRTFYIDNIKLKISSGLSDVQSHHAVTLARDATYFLNRLDAASKENFPLPQKDAWQNQAQQIVKEANAGDASLADKLDQYDQQITSLNAQLFAAIANGKPLITGWSAAFDRLAPDALPPLQNAFAENLTSLRGEHHAFGIDLATGSSGPQKINIPVQGLPASCSITWRRQVFTETWYTKGKTLISDPLTMLAANNKNTFITVQPGEVVRLYADINVGESAVAGNYPVKIELSEDNTLLDTRTLNLQILQQAAPAQRMTNYAFGYISNFPISNHTADAVKDLTAHGVTDIEWAFMPPAVFDAQGNLQKVDFSVYDRLLKDFGPSTIRLNVFWQPSYKTMRTADGTPLKVLSPEWKNALVQIFEAWIKNAREHGENPDHITVLAKDEIHSAALEKSPDESIEEFVQIAQLLHDKIPGIKNYLTLGIYGFPGDVKLALPQVDVAMPHMPMPEKLLRNAPPTYNPRQAFEKEIYPMLFDARKQRGLEISSYHVAAGRSDDLLQWNRFYPVLASVTGHTGIGYWAYNGFSGPSTWDDTDGGLLDYNFVYNGAEKNPLCRQYNVTVETIVPSIRWEAVRAGLQDANIILALQAAEDAGKLSATQRSDFEKLQEQAKLWNGTADASSKTITIAGVEDMSQQLRKIYTEQAVH